ncbi:MULTISPECIES: DUF885 domain-containing protein [Arthrobacter]|uniref:DUF885 domain-containing protein n=1 Tax=Arthrobacter terricola TaxID=2547396 RepID=A0A4R5L0K3_9MICC|nr:MULTISPECIES: DUF885 domain-containing protein [Arthrobacter]MBT8160023.1 DUF885 domain-containing protein [Arthrobacter sp. GN70]TDG01028.1 DUF885 domain-containing protein [Arthrobacter terricola]
MTTPNTTPARLHTAIDAAADAYAGRYLALNPSLATTLGLPGHETEYPDFSPAGASAFAQAARDTLERLSTLEPADASDVITLDAMRERLGLAIEIHESGWDAADLNNIESPAQTIRAIFDLMPTDTAEHWEHIAGRAANVHRAIEGYIESLRSAKDAGKVSAARQVRIVVEQAGKYAAEDGFFAKLAAEASIDGGPLPREVQEKLDSGTAVARAAYDRLASFLETELLPAAPEKDAVGRERYALASRSFLGATVDLEETYAWGVQELERLLAEQERVAAEIKPGASIEEAKSLLNNDSQRQIKGTDALKAWMQELSDRAVADLADVHFDIPDVMKTLECRIAPTDEGGIYYTGPSDDFSRPGRMWWSVPAGEDTFTTWAETTTVFHEGVPGHHLQVATAVYRRELLNNWRRNICWVSGHGEGWALYAEKLMLELGYLKDPGDHMGMLDMQRMRAARVVFDIGVHLELQVPERWGSGTWTPEKGFDFLKANLPISPGQLQFEFNRYLGWPGQAPSYKVGQRLWEEIRTELERRGGFDLKSFHTNALNIGSVGLDTLRRALLG